MAGHVRTITVFGSGRIEPETSLWHLAYAVGRTVAEAGFVLANGGYGGTMAAAAQGAHEAGGQVVGVTCRAFGREGPNPHVTRERVTVDLDQRLAMLIGLGDAYVALPGATGTLREVAKVWELAHKGLTDRSRPIVLVSDFWRPLCDMMRSQDPDAERWVQLVDDAAGVRAVLESLS